MKINSSTIKFADPLGVGHRIVHSINKAIEENNKLAFYAAISTARMINLALQTAALISEFVPNSTIFLAFSTYNKIHISLRAEDDDLLCGLCITNHTITEDFEICCPDNPSCLGLSIEAYLRKDFYRRGQRGSSNRPYVYTTFDYVDISSFGRAVEAVKWIFLTMYNHRVPLEKLHNLCADEYRYSSPEGYLEYIVKGMSVATSLVVNNFVANFSSYIEAFDSSEIFKNYMLALNRENGTKEEFGEKLKNIITEFALEHEPSNSGK